LELLSTEALHCRLVVDDNLAVVIIPVGLCADESIWPASLNSWVAIAASDDELGLGVVVCGPTHRSNAVAVAVS
jgi:hypothetical protein